MNAQQQSVIAPVQISLIKMAQSQLGLDDDTYRSMLMERFRVSSCTQLTYGQASALINELVKKGFKIIRRNRGRGSAVRGRGKNVVAIASPEQMKKIEHLRGLINWQFPDGFERWIKFRFRLEKIKTSREAVKITEGLRGMFENSIQKKHGESWWCIDFKEQPIREYINLHCPKHYRPFMGKIPLEAKEEHYV